MIRNLKNSKFVWRFRLTGRWSRCCTRDAVDFREMDRQPSGGEAGPEFVCPIVGRSCHYGITRKSVTWKKIGSPKYQRCLCPANSIPALQGCLFLWDYVMTRACRMIIALVMTYDSPPHHQIIIIAIRYTRRPLRSKTFKSVGTLPPACCRKIGPLGYFVRDLGGIAGGFRDLLSSIIANSLKRINHFGYGVR